MVRRLVIVVGEPSGDHLGAQLAIALKKIHPSIEIEGVIGPAMISAGCLQLSSMKVLSVMGLIDPIKSLPKILAMRKWLIRYILENPPDLFIGIDSPDFNLNIEKILHNSGIPTVHYVSPSVWAWRRGRIKTIKASVDLMLTLFPFEEQFYKDHAVPVCFTGHPTAELISESINVTEAKKLLGYAASDQVVAVLPGSRNSEMKHMVRVYLQTIKLLHESRPDLKFAIPIVYIGHQIYIEHWKAKIIPNIDLKFVLADSYALMRAADFALVTSGTATLEMMLHKVPMIVAYKTNWLTYKIVKALIKVKYIALPNLLANSGVVPEFIQQTAKPKILAAALLELINSEAAKHAQIEKFKQLHQQLKRGGSQTAAGAIDNLLKFHCKEDDYANSWGG